MKMILYLFMILFNPLSLALRLDSNRACAPTGTSCIIDNNFVPCCNPADTCSPYLENGQLLAYCNPTTQTPSTSTSTPSPSPTLTTTSSQSTSAGCKQQGEPCNLSTPN